MIGAIIAKKAMVKAFQAMDKHDLKMFMSAWRAILYSFTLAKYMQAALSKAKLQSRAGSANSLNNFPKFISTFRTFV